MKFLVASVLSAALCSTASFAAAETTLIYGEAGPNRGVRAQGTEWFVDQVGKLSNGDLKVEVNWGGALFSDKAAVQSIRDGVADLGSVIGVYFPQDMIAYGLADLPIPNTDPWVGMKAVDRIMRTDPKVQENLAKQNLVYVGTYTTSAVQVGCKGKTIRTLDDLKGLKVRGVGVYGKVFADMGATPVDMSVYEAYQALETGLIDCTQTYPYLVKALKFDEVFDSYTELNWGQIGALGILMNKDSFDRLSDADKQALMTAGEQLSDEFGRILGAANEESVQVLRDKSKEIITLPEADRARLVEGGERYIQDWITRADAAGLDGKGMVEQYRTLIAEFTRQRDEKGYPWAPKQ